MSDSIANSNNASATHGYVDIKDDASIKSAMSLRNIMTPGREDGMTRSQDPQDLDDELVNREETPGNLTETTDSVAPDGKPNVPLHEREFICMNDEYSECRTGQVTLNLARKVISNHFGRNKGCTRKIDNWPLFCRKHYQRATYKPDLWQKRKVDLIVRQFRIIEELYPGTTYTVCLKKSEMDRLNAFARALDRGLDQYEAHALVKPDPGNKSFQCPMNPLRELQDRLGPNRTMEDVYTTMKYIQDMLFKGDIKEVPSIEFLPELPETRVPKPDKTGKKAAPRVSKKGGVQKTTATQTVGR